MIDSVELHLTVVDLSELISVANDEQTENDVQVIQSMIDFYLTNSRTIILAVMQANNDIANQDIIQKSRRFDSTGERTMRIITKPNLINKETEKRIARLIKNEDIIKLRVGLFLVRNSIPSELATAITAKQRLAIENQYFQFSPWKEEALSADRVEVESLQRFLQKLLKQHIERELPRVREEIKYIMNRLKQKIDALDDERSTTDHLRVFLFRLAMRFHNLIFSALDGNYFDSDTTFFDDSHIEHHSRRIRALTHRLNTEFSNHMRENDQKRKVITSRSDQGVEPKNSAEENQILVTKQKMND